MRLLSSSLTQKSLIEYIEHREDGLSALLRDRDIVANRSLWREEGGGDAVREIETKIKMHLTPVPNPEVGCKMRKV